MARGVRLGDRVSRRLPAAGDRQLVLARAGLPRRDASCLQVGGPVGATAHTTLRDRRIERPGYRAGAAHSRQSVRRSPADGLLRRSGGRPPGGCRCIPRARQARRRRRLRAGAPRPRDLSVVADGVAAPHDGLARCAARYHGVDLFRARPVRHRTDPGTDERRGRHPGRRRLRDAVRGAERPRQARERHRHRAGRAGAALAGPADPRDPGQAELAGSGHLQAAALRPRRRGNQRLQVPLDVGRRERQDRASGEAQRCAHHVARCDPASHVARRAPAA